MNDQEFEQLIESRLPPLEWKEYKTQARAMCVFGEYIITDTIQMPIYLHLTDSDTEVFVGDGFLTEQRAKAACEADRLKRVLGMFERKDK